MPKIYSKALDMGKILPIKNYLLLVSLLVALIACSAGTNGITNNTVTKPDNYNLTSLITQNSFYTPPGPNVCKNIPINRNPNLQPPKAKCRLDDNSPAQIADGCNVNMDNPHSLGATLAKSIVGIAFPTSSDGWQIGCSGTLIESNEVITATHCLADSHGTTHGQFKPNIQNLVVVPWQLAYHGVPAKFTESTNLIRYKVKISIPYHYAFYDESYTSPYSSYTKDDFALLELESSLPSDYQPIAIESAALNLPPNAQLWTAGYGVNESQKLDGQLHYREAYYYSNLYNTSPAAWPAGNPSQAGPDLKTGTSYGMIYTLGSIPESTESKPPAAWSLLGPGDSGGPLLYYNPDTQRFSILATLTGALYCSYAGFYAQLPYSFDQNTEITESRYTLIEKIINKTANPAEVSCMPENLCSPKIVYVLNKGSNSITIYRLDQNNDLHYLDEVSTGINPQAFTFDASHSYILVANYGSAGEQGSISVFKIMANGTLTATIPQEQLHSNIGSPVAITTNNTRRSTNNSIYMASHIPNTNDSRIFKLELNHDNGILSITKSILIPNANINQIKPSYYVLFAVDSTNNKIFVINPDSLTISDEITNNLNTPTDITKIKTSALITNFADDSITVSYFNHNNIYSSRGKGPSQILTAESDNIVYVINSKTNTIAIFEFNTANNLLNFESTVTTGNRPISMTILGAQLFEVNQADNSLWHYNILPDGKLEYKELIDTAKEPIAVLAN